MYKDLTHRKETMNKNYETLNESKYGPTCL